MSSYLIVYTAAALASGLTLFSGFGLSTLLMPVMALFFPIPTAIAMTALVHLFNNLFKLVLLGRHARKEIVWKFGLPALVSAWFGAQLLVTFSTMPAIAAYQLFGTEHIITPVKCLAAVLMASFALLEVVPRLQSISFKPSFLPVGGFLSGFFGGLSGNQGAFRSAFLAKCGLSKEEFLGTGVASAVLVDLARISVYMSHFQSIGLEGKAPLIVWVTLSAFLGSWIGSRFMWKVTLRAIRILVVVLLMCIAAGLGSGIL